MSFVFKKGKTIFLLAAMVIGSMGFPQSPAAAAGETITISPQNAAGVSSINVPITISGFDSNKSYIAAVSVSSGTLSIATRAGLSASYGYPALNTNSTEFSFYGSYANIAAALASITYNVPGTPGNVVFNATISEYLNDPNVYYFPGNGHYYKYVSSPGATWETAKNASAATSLLGMTGYLVTITTSSENSFVANKTSATNIWIGAGKKTTSSGETQSSTEGRYWRWMTGPEAGTDFFLQTQNSSGGTTSAGMFSSWAAGEPNGSWNGSSWGEDRGVTNWNGVAGQWNDLISSSFMAGGYLIEYGGIGTSTASAASTTASITVTGSQVTSFQYSSSTVAPNTNISYTLNGNPAASNLAFYGCYSITVDGARNLNVGSSTWSSGSTSFANPTTSAKSVVFEIWFYNQNSVPANCSWVSGAPNIQSNTLTVHPTAQLSASNAQITFTEGVNDSISNLTAAGFVGSVTYSITPVLPNGLSLNAATGEISGTPASPHTSTSYTVSALGSISGNASTTFSILVRAGQIVTWAPDLQILPDASPFIPSSLASASDNGTITYSVVSAGATGCAVNSNTGEVSFSQLGVCVVRATAAATANYGAGVSDVSFVIAYPPAPIPVWAKPVPPTLPTNLTALVDDVAEVVEGSKKIEVAITKIFSTGAIQVKADKWGLQVKPESRSEFAPPVEEKYFEIFRDSEMDFSLNGYAGDSTVKVYLIQNQVSLLSGFNRTFTSTSQLNAFELGAYRVGANGVLLDEIAVPASVYLGTSLLQVVGYAPNMTLRTVNVSVDVTDRAKIQLKTITLNVYYKEKKPNHLLPEAMKKLERLVKAVPASAKLTQVKLTGWAAAESGVEYPWSWGIDRAKAVKSQLRKLGLKANYQIKSKGVSVRTNYLGRLVQISIQYALWD